MSNMTKDFGEALTARGFTVQGSYLTLNEMIYPDKEGCDLILTAQVRFRADTSGISYTTESWKGIISGCVMAPLALTAFLSASATPKTGDTVALLFVGEVLTVGAWILSSNSGGFIPSGEVQVGCEIELEAYEGLTGELMWTKTIPIPSLR